VFNFSGSEMIFLLLLALIILGPEKLPDAVRKFGKTYAEFKKVTTGFQQEFRQALDEPIREMRETADALKQAATFDDSVPEPAPKAQSGSMAAVTPTPTEQAPAEGSPVVNTASEHTPAEDAPARNTPTDETPVPRAVQPPFARPSSPSEGTPSVAGQEEPIA